MINQAFNVLGSIIVLAMLATLATKNGVGLVTGFFNGFSGSIKAAKGN